MLELASIEGVNGAELFEGEEGFEDGGAVFGFAPASPLLLQAFDFFFDEGDGDSAAGGVSPL